MNKNNTLPTISSGRIKLSIVSIGDGICLNVLLYMISTGYCHWSRMNSSSLSLTTFRTKSSTAATASKSSGILLLGQTFIPNSLDRSEEHTSELQLRENLVCRL